MRLTPLDNVVFSMSEGISHFEGFYNVKPSLARRNNNPGNIRAWGKTPVVNGYAVFPTLAAGLKALFTQIEKNIARDLTFYEFFAGKPGVYGGYAPGADNNHPTQYATFVVSQVNKDLGTAATIHTNIRALITGLEKAA